MRLIAFTFKEVIFLQSFTWYFTIGEVCGLLSCGVAVFVLVHLPPDKDNSKAKIEL